MRFTVGYLGGILLSVAFSSSAVLAESHAAECEGISDLKDITQAKRGEHTETHAHNYACLLAEIEKLRGGAVMPSGAVVAFDLPNGCPEGWQADISAAAGRMVVGVDGGKFRLPYEEGKPKYVTGGSETHKLNIAEMPSHRHGFAKLSIGANLQWKDGGTGTNVVYFDLPPKSSAGGGQVDYVSSDIGATATGRDQPHNNMPPYIALYYCKKE